ncbi:uncharacterized protein BDR25DRAFT_353856 [Lindgomyces ingoldianus]|uniref:Uncharacterized protein n=1 Tax=Lindgomyces ingoldianus TaxID=673940 RepID=A0ACB6QZB7_9PLEO|nr:uncharacterized protein BDR25DRAFT_353856 [Lindgomyces ingoldianus]KAF2472127.1 hypothetical protein BDR25DRAFT_353856 [Lindgomyces ingoldianus]
MNPTRCKADAASETDLMFFGSLDTIANDALSRTAATRSLAARSGDNCCTPPVDLWLGVRLYMRSDLSRRNPNRGTLSNTVYRSMPEYFYRFLLIGWNGIHQISHTKMLSKLLGTLHPLNPHTTLLPQALFLSSLSSLLLLSHSNSYKMLSYSTICTSNACNPLRFRLIILVLLVLLVLLVFSWLIPCMRSNKLHWVKILLPSLVPICLQVFRFTMQLLGGGDGEDSTTQISIDKSEVLNA